MGEWEVFTKLKGSSKKAESLPRVTIQGDGRWRLNERAAQILGAQVQVLWDAAGRRVGLRAVPADAPNSWRVSGVSRAHSAAILSMARFMEAHGLDLEQYRGTYALIADGEVLTFVLPAPQKGTLRGSGLPINSLTSTQTAKALGLSVQRLEVLRKRWNLGTQVGRQWYYTPDELEQLKARPKMEDQPERPKDFYGPQGRGKHIDSGHAND